MFYTRLTAVSNTVTIRGKNTKVPRGIDTRRKCLSMDRPNVHLHSHLFTVRVWEEVIGTEQTELRGKVQLLTTGEVRYFREWSTLVPLLLTMLSELEPDKWPGQPS